METAEAVIKLIATLAGATVGVVKAAYGVQPHATAAEVAPASYGQPKADKPRAKPDLLEDDGWTMGPGGVPVATREIL